MRRALRPALVAAAALACLAGPVRPAAADPEPATIQTAIERVAPSLVRLNVVEAEYDDGKEVKDESVGSGVIISPEGYVVTNHHVAGNARRIFCVLADNEEIEATLVGTDPLSDIAVVRLEGKPGRTFPAVEFADSDAVRVGQDVLALGNPLALARAVTSGIVSNTKMVMPGSYLSRDRFTMQGESVGTMVRWLVHDARIYPGNSGGPLVDLDGRVVGINEVTFGLSGAIPSDIARDVATQIIEHGRVRRAWLGLELQPLLKDGDREASADRGALVREVVDGSPAGQAGIRAGDILVGLGGADMTARFDEEIPLLNQRMAALPIGVPLEARLSRDGQDLAVTVTAVERQPLRLPDAELSDWGITARDLSFLSATELKLEQKKGVLVTSIRPTGPAGRARPPLRQGDVVREVEGQPVTSLEDLRARTEALVKDRTEPLPVLVRFTRSPEDLVTVVEVGHKPPDRPAADARKAWLPAAVQVITREMASQLGDASMTGLRVSQVYPGTSAEKAGLAVGDLVVALDGNAIEAREPGDESAFAELVRQYTVGTTVTLTIVRAGQRIQVPVSLERSPKADRELKRYQDEQFEFTARDVGFFDRVHEGWPDSRRGAVVTEVVDGGWAALGSLYVGDLVTSVDEVPVEDVAGLEAAMKKVADEKPAYVVLRVLRGIHTWYLQLQTEWSHG